MRYEFIHDSIAKQVFYKAGAEARTRRKVEKYIREHYEAFRERGAELTNDDIEYIKPYLDVVNIGAEENDFIRQGEAKLNRKRLRRRLLTASVIAILFVAAVGSFALWQRSLADRNRAEANATEAARQEAIALAKSDSLEIQGAALLDALEEAKLANDTAEIKRVEAELAKLFAQNQAAIARRQRDLANRRAREARSLALAATAQRIEDELPLTALQLAQTAYGVIPNAPLPAVSQTLSSLFYEQLSDGDDPGAPLYTALMPFERAQFAANRQDRRQRFDPIWSPEGNYYLLPTDTRLAGLYRNDGQRVAELPHGESPVDAAAWAPDGQRLATGDQGGRIILWDVAGKKLTETRTPNWISGLQFSPNGRYLYTWANLFDIIATPPGGSINIYRPQNPKLWVWDTQNPTSLTAIDGFDNYLKSELQFSRDDNYLLLPTGIHQPNGTSRQALDPDGVAIQYAPKANLALTRTNGGRARLWSVPQGRPIASWESVREARLATGSGDVLLLYQDRSVELYAADGERVAQLPPDDYVQIVLAPDGKHLVTRVADRLTLWDRSGKEATLLTETASPDIEPRFSPSGGILLFRADPTHPAIWRPRLGIRELSDVHSANIRALEFDPTGEWILSRDEANHAYLWSSTGRAVSRFDKHQSYIEDAVFSPDASRLVTADRVGRAYLWEVDRAVLAQTVDDGDFDQLIPLPQTEDWLTITRNRQYALWSAGAAGERPLIKSRNAKWALDPTGKRIATQIANRPVSVWDVATGRETATLDPELARLNDIRFSPDGRFLAGVADDGQVLVWSVDGRAQRTWPGEAERNGTIYFAPTGSYVATQTGPVEYRPASNISLQLPVLTAIAPTGGYLLADVRFPPVLFRWQSAPQGPPELRRVPLESSAVPTTNNPTPAVRVWGTDGRARELISFPPRTFPATASFSPDGVLAAVQLYGSGTVITDSLGRLLTINRALAGPQQVFFSPDNRHLAATYGTPVARVFDRSGKQRAELNQLNETVAEATFSPDGRQLLLRGNGKTAQLYNLDGQLLATFDRHGSNLQAARFSRDGRYILTLERSGTLRRYPVPDEIYAWLQRTNRLPPLTEAERASYGLTDLQLDTN